MNVLTGQPRSWREFAILMPVLLALAAAIWFALSLMRDVSWGTWALMMAFVTAGAAVGTAVRVRRSKS